MCVCIVCSVRMCIINYVMCVRVCVLVCVCVCVCLCVCSVSVSDMRTRG